MVSVFATRLFGLKSVLRAGNLVNGTGSGRGYGKDALQHKRANRDHADRYALCN
jgi:hypothetical protein